MELELQRKPPQMLEGVELIFPTKIDNAPSNVNIKQCKIKRQQINQQTQRHECAIEFKEIAEDQQKKLTTLFYQWQRDYLKKRRLFEV
jgi:c-di-GMP-binding flagellar brake protein YcgR